MSTLILSGCAGGAIRVGDDVAITLLEINDRQARRSP
jgi:sRNA-binding carbon storage regulator CsrA